MTTTINDAMIDVAENLLKKHHHTLPNGRLLRLSFDVDTETRINDFECYGKVEPVALAIDTGEKILPAGFNHLAEEIIDIHGRHWWWQPTLSLWGFTEETWTPKNRKDSRQIVLDILSYGFNVVTVEIYEGKDFYGKPIVVNAKTMGGLEPTMTHDDTVAIISELLYEADIHHEIADR